MPTKPSTLSRSVIPSLASVTIHAGLFAALVGITIDRFVAPAPRAARVSIEAAAPPPQAAAPKQADQQPETQASAQPVASTEPVPPQEARAAAEQLEASAVRTPPPRIAPTRAAPSLPTPSAAPAASFAGMRSQAANRVVFAVDASGAMVTTFTFIQDELTRAIDRLQPTQSFQIILFGERNTAEGHSPYRMIPHDGSEGDLIRATSANRVLARRWITAAIPGGRSNPIEALTAALDFEPDLVFLLARGIQRTGAIDDPADTTADLAALDAKNPVDPRSGFRPAVIKAVEFIEPDPSGTIARIAQIHGDGAGSSRLVTPENFEGPGTEAQPGDDPGNQLPDSVRAAFDRADAALRSVRATLETVAVLSSVADADETARVRTAATEALAVLSDAPPATRRTADPRPNLARAEAALLLATVQTSPAARRELASRAIADASPLRIADQTTAAVRDITTARARLLAGQPQAAHDALLALLRTAEPTTDEPLTAPLASARLALLDAADALGPTTTEATRARDMIAKSLTDRSVWPDPAWRALASASLARSRLTAGEPVASALEPLIALYEAPTLSSDTRRALAAPRIALLAGDRDDLPLPALNAVADHAGWTGNHAMASDYFERIATLEQTPMGMADAVRDAAFHARAAGQRARARDLYRRLAAEYPGHPDAEAALTLALDTADLTADDLARALEINPTHPLANDWRLTLAAMQRGSAGLGVLEAITDSTRASAALALELIDELLPRVRTDAERSALLERAAQEAQRLGSTLDPRRRLTLAASLAMSDPDAALRTLDGLPVALRTSADADRVRLDASEARADDALIFATARDIAARRSPGDGDLYWRAVTIWLELGARNGGPDAAAAARAHIAGLRRTHPALGGEPWSERLETLTR